MLYYILATLFVATHLPTHPSTYKDNASPPHLPNLQQNLHPKYVKPRTSPPHQPISPLITNAHRILSQPPLQELHPRYVDPSLSLYTYIHTHTIMTYKACIN